MSQTYRIRVKESVSETISLNREWKRKVNLLKILPESEMGDLLCAELAELGWKGSEHKSSKEEGHWRLELDPITLLLSIIYDREEEVEASFDEEVEVYEVTDLEDKARQNAQDQAKENLDRRMNTARNRKETELLKELNQSRDEILNTLENELQAAVEQTHMNALKLKAAALGEIEAIEENSGEIVIRVKV
ncbi:hypothetical protein HOF92_00240 [bacterium]|jgi:hypothetical protein|nr:hypothetical protein [bacterium]